MFFFGSTQFYQTSILNYQLTLFWLMRIEVLIGHTLILTTYYAYFCFSFHSNESSLYSNILRWISGNFSVIPIFFLFILTISSYFRCPILACILYFAASVAAAAGGGVLFVVDLSLKADATMVSGNSMNQIKINFSIIYLIHIVSSYLFITQITDDLFFANEFSDTFLL